MAASANGRTSPGSEGDGGAPPPLTVESAIKGLRRDLRKLIIDKEQSLPYKLALYKVIYAIQSCQSSLEEGVCLGLFSLSEMESKALRNLMDRDDTIPTLLRQLGLVQEGRSILVKDRGPGSIQLAADPFRKDREKHFGFLQRSGTPEEQIAFFETLTTQSEQETDGLLGTEDARIQESKAAFRIGMEQALKTMRQRLGLPNKRIPGRSGGLGNGGGAAVASSDSDTEDDDLSVERAEDGQGAEEDPKQRIKQNTILYVIARYRFLRALYQFRQASDSSSADEEERNDLENELLYQYDAFSVAYYNLHEDAPPSLDKIQGMLQNGGPTVAVSGSGEPLEEQPDQRDIERRLPGCKEIWGNLNRHEAQNISFSRGRACLWYGSHFTVSDLETLRETTPSSNESVPLREAYLQFISTLYSYMEQQDLQQRSRDSQALLTAFTTWAELKSVSDELSRFQLDLFKRNSLFRILGFNPNLIDDPELKNELRAFDPARVPRTDTEALNWQITYGKARFTFQEMCQALRDSRLANIQDRVEVPVPREEPSSPTEIIAKRRGFLAALCTYEQNKTTFPDLKTAFRDYLNLLRGVPRDDLWSNKDLVFSHDLPAKLKLLALKPILFPEARRRAEGAVAEEASINSYLRANTNTSMVRRSVRSHLTPAEMKRMKKMNQQLAQEIIRRAKLRYEFIQALYAYVVAETPPTVQLKTNMTSAFKAYRLLIRDPSLLAELRTFERASLSRLEPGALGQQPFGDRLSTFNGILKVAPRATGFDEIGQTFALKQRQEGPEVLLSFEEPDEKAPFYGEPSPVSVNENKEDIGSINIMLTAFSHRLKRDKASANLSVHKVATETWRFIKALAADLQDEDTQRDRKSLKHIQSFVEQTIALYDRKEKGDITFQDYPIAIAALKRERHFDHYISAARRALQESDISCLIPWNLINSPEDPSYQIFAPVDNEESHIELEQAIRAFCNLPANASRPVKNQIQRVAEDALHAFAMKRNQLLDLDLPLCWEVGKDKFLENCKRNISHFAQREWRAFKRDYREASRFGKAIQVLRLAGCVGTFIGGFFLPPVWIATGLLASLTPNRVKNVGHHYAQVWKYASNLGKTFLCLGTAVAALAVGFITAATVGTAPVLGAAVDSVLKIIGTAVAKGITAGVNFLAAKMAPAALASSAAPAAVPVITDTLTGTAIAATAVAAGAAPFTLVGLKLGLVAMCKAVGRGVQSLVSSCKSCWRSVREFTTPIQHGTIVGRHGQFQPTRGREAGTQALPVQGSRNDSASSPVAEVKDPARRRRVERILGEGVNPNGAHSTTNPVFTASHPGASGYYPVQGAFVANTGMETHQGLGPASGVQETTVYEV